MARQSNARRGATLPKPSSTFEHLAEAYGQPNDNDPFFASFVFGSETTRDYTPARCAAATNPVEPEANSDPATSATPGLGLEALLGDDRPEQPVDEQQSCCLPLSLICPNPNSPRGAFKPGELEDLARSIREKGLLQPLIVRPRSYGGYEIVAGERRWRAAHLAELGEIPTLIRELSDAQALEIALVENVLRSDLNPLEEAQGYARLVEGYGYSQQELASAVGKSRSHVANMLRLLTLPDEIKAHLQSGSLTAGHARTLVAMDAPVELADQIIKRSLSVRDSERLASSQQASRASNGKVRPQKGSELRALQHKVSEALGLRVDIVGVGRSGGRVVVHVKSMEQLKEVCRRLARPVVAGNMGR